MKMAPICVWIAAGSSCGSSDIGSLQSESDRNLSLPHDRPLSTPHGIFAALAMTGGELARLFLGVALGLAREPQGARCMVVLTHPTVALPTWRIVTAASIGNALKWFDLLVYGYLAVTLFRLFFPSNDENASLLLTLGTFGVSYLVRPIGALATKLYDRTNDE